MNYGKLYTVSLQKTYQTDSTSILKLFKNSTIFKLTGANEIQSAFETNGLFCLTFTGRGIIHGRFIRISENEIILELNVDGFQRPKEIMTILEIIMKNESGKCTLLLKHKNIVDPGAASAKQKAWKEILEDIEKVILQ